MTAIALTVAGSDSSGGAGIQADLKTFSALGIYGASVLTALTAQNTRGVQAIHPVPADFVAGQIDSVFDDLAVGAVKTGMLGGPDVIRAVAAGLARHRARPVVVDPVMIASTGARLLPPDAVEALRADLLPLADLLTPNLPETAALLDEPVAEDEEQVLGQARRLLALGPKAVLVKGGHGTGPESVDLLLDATGAHRFAAPRIATRNTHGTGCTLAAAITARLAAGATLRASVADAKAYLTASLAAADRLAVGSGRGPVHHFHRWWPA